MAGRRRCLPWILAVIAALALALAAQERLPSGDWRHVLLNLVGPVVAAGALCAATDMLVERTRKRRTGEADAESRGHTASRVCDAPTEGIRNEPLGRMPDELVRAHARKFWEGRAHPKRAGFTPSTIAGMDRRRHARPVSGLKGLPLTGWKGSRGFFPPAVLRMASLSESELGHAFLSRANLSGAHLDGVDLNLADLKGARLYGAHLRWADLTGADLSGADLRKADLWRAHLLGANLTGASLGGADLWEANLQDACLRGANLTGASLAGARFHRTKLDGATLPDGTEWAPGTDMARFTDLAHPDFWCSDDADWPP